MPATDKQDRPYAVYDDLKAGQRVWLDGGFTCHPPGEATIRMRAGRPFFECQCGEHNLDGQIDDEGLYCVGVYLNDPGPLQWENEPSI